VNVLYVRRCPQDTVIVPTRDEEARQPADELFVDKTQQLIGDTSAFTNVLRKRLQPRKLVVGESATNKRVKAVTTIHVSLMSLSHACIQQLLMRNLLSVSMI